MNIKKTYEEYRGSEIPVYRIKGNMLSEDAQLWRETYNTGLHAGEYVSIAHLKDMTWINSVGISALIVSQIKAQENDGILIFAEPTPRIHSIFQVTNLTTILKVADSLEDALGIAYEHGKSHKPA